MSDPSPPQPPPEDALSPGGSRPDSVADSAAARALAFAAEPTQATRGSKHWQPPTPQALQALLPGYQINKLLGRGGMGAVYRGVQIQLDRAVAVKILPPGLADEDPSFAERFKNEARLMAKLVHPHIVSVFDSGQTAGGQLFFVMELVDGTDVARMIAEQSRLTPEQARTICVHVCDALGAAHELGIVHRDVKPANVLINKKGQVKVADFGLARLHDPAHSGLTRTGYAVGTPDYIAPEMYTPGTQVDGRADLYAVGVMLYQMLTGELPRGAFKPASVLVPGIDRRFDVVIDKAMQVNREDRYATTVQMRHDLERLTVALNFRESTASTVAVPVGRLTAERQAQMPVTEIPLTPKPASKPHSASHARQKTGANPPVAVKKTAGALLWRTERRTRIVTAILSVLLCAATGYLALRRLGEGLVTLSYDLPFLVHRAGGAEDVRAVYLDQLEGDLLDRRVQAPLLDKLREAGARAVVYDVIFDREWPDKAVDQTFADAIRQFRGVDAADKPIPGARRGVVLLACGRELLGQTGAVGEKLIPPNDTLLAAADDFGLVTLIHDDSFTVRELATGTRDEASITWKTAALLGVKLDEATRLEPRWINYIGPPPHADQPDVVAAIPAVSAKNVLDGVDPSFFRDKVVVIGGKAGIVSPKLGEDLFSTPFHRLDRRGNLPLMSGVEIQASILANLLQQNWLTRSSHGSDLILILAVAGVAGLGLSRVRPLFGLMFTVLGVVSLAIAGVLAVHYGRVWFPWSVAAFVQMPVALVGGTAAHFYIERFFRLKLTKEQEKLREAFSRYLSPRMLERLTDEGFQLDPGGDKAQAAMMFTDIESFTDMCQRVRDPERIVENLNGYFERTTSHIFDHDGIVIKFIGDAIFAAWGVPFADEQAPLKSVRAAWKLYENAKLIVGGDELRTRVGLHFGEVVAGNIGSSKHIDYTLIGDAVNLAARLESLNKALGTNILLSEAVHAHLGGEFCTRRVGQFRVKGRHDVTTVYELLGPASQTELPSWAHTYHDALAAFESGDPFHARTLFTQADQTRLHGDGPARFFLDFLAKGEKSEAGVVDLKEK
ncbi:adenylate/guanylate cyclase domain-containing protein [Prosthecobacter sp.]|uniref:protein kinase domain-containing protein n=1 Tax=Prosthecobacter sp. TaxID=1965333 RepID=UPI002AB8D058|nr:adenylate/guanylate cyclase domain-containing protein [Prosthecobacter sp.]MDZ4405031.1 protein kinase [Prosthecobacter sp.]